MAHTKSLSCNVVVVSVINYIYSSIDYGCLLYIMMHIELHNKTYLIIL